ncbi:MAG: ArsR/SmtB family transcription factor, partial [Nitrospinales bacterium]
ILRQARLVESRKEGRWMYYRLAGDNAPSEVREALAWVTRSLSRNPRVGEDARRLKEILKRNPAELCQIQQGNVSKPGTRLTPSDKD